MPKLPTPLQRPLDNARAQLNGDNHVGLLAEFEHPGALMDGVTRLRERGYTRLDTFSPFPIHGMDRAMGLGVSPLGFVVFGMGIIGTVVGFLLQWWTSEVDYPINVSNKPLFSLEASVPIMFELTILFAALGAVGGMLALNALPRPYSPLFHSERFGDASDDKFFVQIEQADPQFDRARTAQDLVAVGGRDVEMIDHEGSTPLDDRGEPLASAASGDGADPGGTGGNGAALPAPATPQHTDDAI